MNFRICILSISLLAGGVSHGQFPGGDAFDKTLGLESVPPVTEWREADTEGKVKARTQKALLAGPDDLEKLGQHLLADEFKDGDGRYPTTYFHLVLGDAGEKIRGLDRMDYQLRTVKEWRKRYPESQVAMVAEARVLNRKAVLVLGDSGTIPDMEEQRKAVNALCLEAIALLEKAPDLRKKDPAWHVTYVSTLRMMEPDDGRFEAAVDEMLTVCPDSGYALSRAVKYLMPTWGKDGRIWEKWLRGKLAKLPADQAAMLYARTISDLAMELTVDNAVWGVTVDRTMLNRGFDLLAKEYPQSIGIASEEARLGGYLTFECQRIRDALRRAGGRIDQMALTKVQYQRTINLMARVPWDPKEIGVPEVRGYTDGSPEGFAARMDAAVKDGPRGLEELIQDYRSGEMKDKDGRYPSCSFFAWFTTDVNRLGDLRKAMEKEQLIAAWQKEFPASPFARLASAYFWIGRAWDARGGSYSYGVRDSQWKEFNNCMERATKALDAAGELRETEPAWCVAAMKIQTATGGELGSEEFARAADSSFARFSDCVELLDEILVASKPKWGGEAGAWLDFIRAKLEGDPAKQAVAYALAVGSIESYAAGGENAWKETYGQKVADVRLIRKGCDILAARYPDSRYLANLEGLVFSKRCEDPRRALAGMKRMSGVVDLKLWRHHGLHAHFERWIATKHLE